MARYIDVDKLRETSSVWMDGNVLVMSVQDVDNAPTVDVVEVVRCKDCKYWNEREMECNNDYVATDNEGGASFSLNFYLDDFCSYGERRTDNDL